MNKARTTTAETRPEKGSSIVSVMCFATLAAAWLLAASALIMPTYQKISQGKAQVMARSAAEAALDYAVSELTKTANAQGGLVADDATKNGVPVSTTVPTSVLPPGASATVWVNNVSPPSNSYLYDPTLDPAVNASLPPGNFWRVVTAQATAGTASKTLRVVLRPSYAMIQRQVTTTVNVQQTINPFTYMCFAQSAILFTGNHVGTDSYDSKGAGGVNNRAATDADVGSNGVGVSSSAAISLAGQVGGDVNYYGPGSAAGGVAHVTGGAGSPPITGDMNTNDVQSAAYSGEARANVGGAYNANLSNGPMSLATPTVPSNATPLASGFSGTLAPGVYVTQSLTGVITPAAGPGSVQIYVQNNLSLNSGGDLSGYDASKLQIYYSGTSGSIALNGSGGQFCGCVYAPNLNADINGQGHFFGSLIASNISYHGGGNSGGYSFDRNLLRGTTSMTITVPQTTTVTTNVTQESHFVAVSWQEL